MATTGTHNCGDFVSPSSLKELLDLFAKLEVPNGNVKEEVLKELKNRLTGGGKGWIRNGAEFGYYSNIDGSPSGSIPKTIAGLKDLRTNILGNGQNNFGSYGNYTFPENINSGTNASEFNCIKKYADAIIQNAFPLFGCLFYLWFMCVDGESGSAKAGSNHKLKNKNGTSGFTGWEEQNVKNGSDKDLNNFLTGTPEKDKNNSVPMLTRKFSDGELKGSTQGQKLFKNGQNLFSLLCDIDPPSGHFQQALFFLVFLAPRWHPAMSGHALLFLDWFSKNASSVFSDVQWLHVKDAGKGYFQKDCKGNGLEQAIQTLAKGSDPKIAPVHKNSIDNSGGSTNGNPCNLYWPENTNGHETSSGKGKAGHNGKSILHDNTSFNGDTTGHRKAHVFMQYVSWLWWCLPHLTASLELMRDDSENWNKQGESFKHSSSFGPFAFGFTFTDDKWQSGNGKNGQLQEKLDKLITAIDQFKCCFEAFFWAIRKPFACGSLIAWILSLTFLLYVHFMPLDLFHIQSHCSLLSSNKSPIRPLHEVSYFSGA